MHSRSLRKHVALAIACLVPGSGSAQQAASDRVLEAGIGPKTSVTFFWVGDIYAHGRTPFTLRVAQNATEMYRVQPQSAPTHIPVAERLAYEGINVYVSAEQMRAVLHQLSITEVPYGDWTVSSKREPILMGGTTDGLAVTVLASKKTYKTYIRVTRICDELSPFDALMPTEEIRWDFQSFRADFGCKIPGFINPHSPF